MHIAITGPPGGGKTLLKEFLSQVIEGFQSGSGINMDYPALFKLTELMGETELSWSEHNEDPDLLEEYESWPDAKLSLQADQLRAKSYELQITDSKEAAKLKAKAVIYERVLRDRHS